jgi:hypothetical protein
LAFNLKLSLKLLFSSGLDASKANPLLLWL